ncbi:MAG: DUF547 domain-containing protein [Pseudohongiellaceae bacterium]
MTHPLLRHILLLTCLALTGPVSAQIDTVFSHWSTLLEDYLIEQPLENGGLVSAFDYEAALSADGTSALLREQREALAGFDPATLETREQATAFWLNAYNFFMAAHILEERPDGGLVESVWDYGGRYNPFRENVFERELFDVGGTMVSLDGIEKDTLLGESFRQRGWADARVHFAVNCASVGCPPLRQQAYTADNVNGLLTANTRLAFSTPYQLRVEDGTLHLTSLFDWYQADFLAEADSIRDFIAQYAGESVTGLMRTTSRIEFIDYDWRLNTPEHFPEIP